MKFRCALLCATISLMLGPMCGAQTNPKPENATTAVLRAFETHEIVMFGEMHDNKQEFKWLRSLVATPEFADRVDDIVMEFGNSLYQKSVDRYVSGDDVPMDQVQKAWRNMAGIVGPPSPVYASLYQAVRETNLKRRGKHQMRVLCGDPYIDWEKITNREQISPYLNNRDEWYAKVVKDEVLAKHHRALLIMGSFHFLHDLPKGQKPSVSVEEELRRAGANTYLIVFGTNATGGYDDLDHRFDSWPVPVIVSLADNWVGELPTMPTINGGVVPTPTAVTPGANPVAASAMKLKDSADALLYLGPRDSLIAVGTPRAVADTPYSKEVTRRLTIEGFPATFISNLESQQGEAPQFPRPQPGGGRPPITLPPLKNVGAPLPPRPPSQ